MGLSTSRREPGFGTRVTPKVISLTDLFAPDLTTRADTKLVLFSFMSHRDPVAIPRARTAFAGYCGPVTIRKMSRRWACSRTTVDI